jgi:O-antigen ligase
MSDRSDRIGGIMTIGLFLLMGFSALAFGTVEPWSVAIFGLSVTALLSLWAVKSVVQRRLTFRAPAVLLPLAALLTYGAVQSISYTDGTGKRWSISMDVEATRFSLELIACLLIASLIATHIFEDRERLSWLRDFLIFFGLAVAVFGLLQHFTWNGKYYWVFEPSVPPPSPFGPFVNHNHFAGYMEMIVPIPVAMVLTRAVRGERALFYGFAAAIMGVATIVSLSRGGMISLISGLMFVVILGFRPSRREQFSAGPRFPLLLSRLAATAVIILIIGAGVWWVGADSVISRVEKIDLSIEGSSADPRRETFYQSRGWIWRDTIAMIRDHWVAGVGLGAYPTVYPIYNERNGSLSVNQAHNDYLQIVADCGIIGAIAAVCFVVLVSRDIRRSLGHRDRKSSALALGCGGGIFAMLVHSLFDFNLQLPSNALLFIVLTAVISNIGWAVARKSVTRELEVWS